MRQNDPVVAIYCSDIHLCSKPPLFRSAEPDWYEAMARPLRQLKELSVSYNVPIICAGDVFDRWNPPPELINFALTNLPVMYSIPGQHDLPMHSYTDIKKSAYWTLVYSGTLNHLEPGKSVTINNIRLHPFPWGFEVTPLQDPHDLLLEVAVIHAYIWTKKTGYHGAPQGKRAGRWREKLAGYDGVVFGDNHNPFIISLGDGRGSIVNTGGFMVRKSDDRHKPGVVLLHNSGAVSRYELDISNDKYLDSPEAAVILEGLGRTDDFLSELSSLTDTALNFAEYVRRHSNELPVSVKKIVLAALEEGL